MPTLTLTKHHALGNDFLVLLDTDDAYATSHGAMAVALCDRRSGIGADGLLRLGPDLRMHLHNADGSRAEMSGNGIRCLAQAILDLGVDGGPELDIVTDAGVRRVVPRYDQQARRQSFTVDMGIAKVVDLEERRAEVDTGNPHLVLLVADPATEQLEELGAENPDVNVEVVRVDDAATVTMRVHERGAGITRACGTGSCAIAAATRAWGLTGDRIVVHNPGGDLEVELEGDTAWLTGPATFIGRVEVVDQWR
ncbi:MAG TPA: diaminopimelate epimerase [Acidimicrobiales bacterium]|nr:diaminopimelate epimerase [Acidimicrobiales bacterium]